MTSSLGLVVQVMSALLGVLRSADEALQEFLIQQVTALVALLKAHMRKWLADILDVIGSFWAVASPLLPGLLRLLSELAGESCPEHLSPVHARLTQSTWHVSDVNYHTKAPISRSL